MLIVKNNGTDTQTIIQGLKLDVLAETTALLCNVGESISKEGFCGMDKEEIIIMIAMQAISAKSDPKDNK